MSDQYAVLRRLIEECVRAIDGAAAEDVADSVLCGLLNYGVEREINASSNGDLWTTQKVLQLALAPAKQRSLMGFASLADCTVSSKART